MKSQEMIREALTLSPKDKSLLIEALLYSLDKPDAEIEEIWNKDIEKRIENLEKGNTKTVPFHQVFGDQ